MICMLKRVFNRLWNVDHGDLSKHRLHTLNYEDLCK